MGPNHALYLGPAGPLPVAHFGPAGPILDADRNIRDRPHRFKGEESPRQHVETKKNYFCSERHRYL